MRDLPTCAATLIDMRRYINFFWCLPSFSLSRFKHNTSSCQINWCATRQIPNVWIPSYSLDAFYIICPYESRNVRRYNLRHTTPSCVYVPTAWALAQLLPLPTLEQEWTNIINQDRVAAVNTDDKLVHERELICTHGTHTTRSAQQLCTWH